MYYYSGNFEEVTNFFRAYPFYHIYILCHVRNFLKNTICNKICNGRYTKPSNATK
jgi:hypothetical protein